MSESQTINVPAWHKNVPVMFANGTVSRYFRFLNMDNWILQLGESKSKFVERNFDIVDKNATAREGKRFPVQHMAPPCRTIWTYLDGTGDFNKMKGVTQPLDKSHYSVTIYEGDIPQDMTDLWPGLAAEQKAYFDWLEAAEEKVKWLMWEHPEVRKNHKLKLEAYAIANWQFPGCSNAYEKTEAMKLPENQEKLRLDFFASCNVDNKDRQCPMVRNKLVFDPQTHQMVRPKHDIPGRYVTFKKNLCNFMDDNAAPTKDKLPKNKNHYLNVLTKLKKVISPPVIFDCRANALQMDIKENPADEKPRLVDMDMICITPFIKPYDAGMFGVRGQYCNSSIMRKASLSERRTNGQGMDFSSCAISSHPSNTNNNNIPEPSEPTVSDAPTLPTVRKDPPSGYQSPDEEEEEEDEEQQEEEETEQSSSESEEEDKKKKKKKKTKKEKKSKKSKKSKKE